MSRVYLCGLGAVSPAGWGVEPLRRALEDAKPLPVQDMERPGWKRPLAVRTVPPPSPRPAFFSHPRLRRVNPLTQYAAAAALEAVAQLPKGLRLGLVFCMQAGPVQYAARFFAEARQNPATASPMLFPETVFAAPASHVAALLGNVPLVYTFAGDAAVFLQGLALGCEWLNDGQVDTALVLGGEELHWLPSGALSHFERHAISTAGAGAVCLGTDRLSSLGVELEAITDAHTYSRAMSPEQAAQAVRSQLPAGSPKELLCDSVGGNGRSNAAEQDAWNGWPGPRLSPVRIFGEGLVAGAGWQCVAAADAIARKQVAAAIISIVGKNQQAIGARFVAARNDQ